MIGSVSVNFVPVLVTFDEELVEMYAEDIAVTMERMGLAITLFGDIAHQEDEEF